MTSFLVSLAVALGHLLGLALPLGVPCLVLLPRVPCAPGAGQVPHVPGLPGEWTPQTGGGAP